MSLWIDQKYLSLISVRLERFQRKSDKLYNFRCPFCGDSKKSKWKARGFVYVKKGGMFYKCHNCGHGTNMKGLLAQVDPNTLAEYNMEKFKEPRNLRTEAPAYEFEAPKFKKKDTAHLHFKPISGPALEYAKERKLPDHMIETLFWVEDSQTLEYMDAKYEGRIIGHEPRLIIPFLDQQGNLFGYQGRGLSSKSTLRYITIMIDDSMPKLFGLDEVDVSKTVYVTEGPIDSMFVDNCIAMAGSDLAGIQAPEKVVMIYDNEPRNKQIVDKMDKSLNYGRNIVVWPSKIEEKDINDMIMRGMSKADLSLLISQNTHSGLSGKMALSVWSR